jgi:hypothetical protein
MAAHLHTVLALERDRWRGGARYTVKAASNDVNGAAVESNHVVVRYHLCLRHEYSYLAAPECAGNLEVTDRACGLPCTFDLQRATGRARARHG